MSNANVGSAGLRNGEPSGSARMSDLGLRGIVFLAGLGLLLGFFLPWLRFGQVAAVSGLSLMVSSGAAVDALAGPSRGLLILIPACGAAMIGTSFLGPRAAILAALVSGVAILAFGILTFARIFLETVGSGMWIVVVSALMAIGAGIAGIARSRSAD